MGRLRNHSSPRKQALTLVGADGRTEQVRAWSGGKPTAHLTGESPPPLGPRFMDDNCPTLRCGRKAAWVWAHCLWTATPPHPQSSLGSLSRILPSLVSSWNQLVTLIYKPEGSEGTLRSICQQTEEDPPTRCAAEPNTENRALLQWRH